MGEDNYQMHGTILDAGLGHPTIPWMPQAQAVPNCPPGLEYLASVDCFHIRQQVELLEAFTGFEQANKYEILNSINQRVYFAVERTDCCTRNCCGNKRPFEISLYDAYQREVLKLKRYLRADSCFCPCCLQKMEVFTASEQMLGCVKQTWSVCKPHYNIRDSQENVVMTMQGPCFTSSCCGDVNFEILDKTGTTRLGLLTKQFSGVIREVFTDADHFMISFPIDLDVATKATLLGAAFLVDFMFFEKNSQGKSGDGIGMLG
ncbi:phospholipid scramblase 1-like [Watersipora subatra]|uniref:phospholipid scramblase 1-like n=1 Tax=Watersipora subatra TaxID=2589382 RepID=UPI00355C26B8